MGAPESTPLRSTCSVRGRQGGVAEGGVGAANVAHGAEVGQGKAVEVLGFVADGAELEAAVTNGKAAAVPVIDGLHAGVLQLAEDKVVAGVGGKVEAGAALLADGNEGLHLLALDGGGGAAVLVDCVEHGVAHADGGAAPTVARVEVVGSQLPALGVVVQVPLNAQVVDGLKAQARSDGRQVARRREEGHGAHVQRGVEDVAAAGDERAAEVGSIERFWPICQLAHSRALCRALAGWLSRSSGAQGCSAVGRR